MNRDEALELLMDGKVEEWNTLRISGESIPNLSGEILSDADLISANLISANLSDARGHGKEISLWDVNDGGGKSPAGSFVAAT